METNHEIYIQRCFDLALLGNGSVSPNPMVGAVLVAHDRIIGEGWHRQYGGAHAEVNCIASVLPENIRLIEQSTLYCNLEPCFHYGKTPPCVDLVLRHRIPRVVIANIDANEKVGGQSVQKLREHGVEVLTNILEDRGKWLNRAFFAWIETKRPYVMLKWAQSADGFIGQGNAPVAISTELTRRLVHKWRAESDAILVGSKTALIDNPRLDNRYYVGKSPLRILIDGKSTVPLTHHLFADGHPTLVFGPYRPNSAENVQFHPVSDQDVLPSVLETLHTLNKAILLVEGGANTLQRFMDQGLVDEIRVITNTKLLQFGVSAPVIASNFKIKEHFSLKNDDIKIYVKD